MGDGGGLLSSGINIPFYDIPNQNIERCGVSHGVRLKHWRAVGHGFNKYAIEAFLDEIAADQSIDPYQLRRTLLRNCLICWTRFFSLVSLFNAASKPLLSMITY